MPTIDAVKLTDNTIKTQQKNQVDKDLFLRILTTQLRNQDPTQPMEDREFVAQMAQFSTLEQISNLNQSFNQFMNSRQGDISQFSTMINKEVSWTNEEIGQEETGVVIGIVKKDNQFYYQVNEQEIPVETIISAKDRQSQS